MLPAIRPDIMWQNDLAVVGLEEVHGEERSHGCGIGSLNRRKRRRETVSFSPLSLLAPAEIVSSAWNDEFEQEETEETEEGNCVFFSVISVGSC
jgi:hypothetical protein